MRKKETDIKEIKANTEQTETVIIAGLMSTQ